LDAAAVPAARAPPPLAGEAARAAAPAGGEAAAGGEGVIEAPSPPCLLLAGTGVAPGGRVLEASVKSVRGGLGAWGPAWGACTPSLKPPVVAPWPRPAPRAAQHT